MEVEAIVQALKCLRHFPGEVVVVSDCLRVVQDLDRLGRGNLLAEVILVEFPGLRVELKRWQGPAPVWRWVRGHSGNGYHGKADRAARAAARREVEAVRVEAGACRRWELNGGGREGVL